MEVSVFDALERRLNEHKAEITEFVSGGGVKSMEDYNLSLIHISEPTRPY